MQNKGLIFIPDISGFTRFVTSMELDHSRLIIQELLEILVGANNIGLEISEIEGDAILFYKYGESPDLQALYEQVGQMFRAFHRHLIAYDNRRYCQCEACSSAIDLTLKVITHYGEFTNYQVQHFIKLIGKDIIVAHQLLKNDIAQHEYWLITQSLLHGHPPDNLAPSVQWNNSVKQTENGAISFYYTTLSSLKDELLPEPLSLPDLTDKVKVLSFSKEYNAGIIQLFHASGDFHHRARWQEGVKSVEEVNHFLPRVGMRCRYVYEDGETMLYTTSYAYSPNRIEFSETEENKKNVFYYLLEATSDHTTKLTIDYYIQKNFILQILFNLSSKKKVATRLQKSLVHLEGILEQIKLPGEA